jgi:hypothetical protein
MLDVKAFKDASLKLDEEGESSLQQWKLLRTQHIQDVWRFQKAMQNSDMVFWEPPDRVGLKKNRKWMSVAVNAANLHRRKLRDVMGVKDSDILQINVFCLYALGTAKKGVLAEIATALNTLKGVTLVFYPVAPTKTNRVTLESGIAGAGGDGDASTAESTPADGGSDSDVDAEVHDFNGDGVLPEALTSLHSVKSVAQRHAQLAQDCHEVDRVIGFSEPLTRYPKRVHFLHSMDGSGDLNGTSAMLLVPTEAEVGVDAVKLGESVLFRSGTFTDVPVPRDYLAISKKIANQSRRVMSEGWGFEQNIRQESSGRFASSKVSRAQLGSGLHELWLKDIIKACGTKAIYVCDFAHGSAELQKAVLAAKVSVEATSNGVRVCSWSHDPRKIFAEIGRVRCMTLLGQHYIKGLLTLPGHVPVPDPGDEPVKSRKLMRAMIGKPLKALNLDSEGMLLIPTDVEISRSCPVQLDPEMLANIAAWRVEFPRLETVPEPTAPVPADPMIETPESSMTTATTLEVGATHSDLSKVGGVVQQTVPLPEGGPRNISLVLVSHAGGVRRVWLHNTTDKDLSLPAGSFLGTGGRGSLVSLVSSALTDAQKPFAWRYTRITNHKRDSAELANGFLLFNKGGQPLAPGKPKLMHLDAIETELGNKVTLYGHSITRGNGNKVTVVPSPTTVVWISGEGTDEFSTDTLGHYIPSHEDVSGAAPKLIGLVRPVFEVVPSPQVGGSMVLQPKMNSRTLMTLFTIKKLDIKAKHYMLL